MHLYSEQHIIYGDYAFQQWDAELVADLLKQVNPYNMRIDLVSKNFDKNRPGIHNLSFLSSVLCALLWFHMNFSKHKEEVGKYCDDPTSSELQMYSMFS